MRTVQSEDSLLLIIDVQDKLVKMLKDDSVKKNAVIISKAAGILNIPAVITEQYPKGLGYTELEIKAALPNAGHVEKTFFSAYSEPEFKNITEKSGKKQVVIFGIEAHICVLQTAFDLNNNGYEVFIVENASGSRNESDKNSALRRAELAGIQVITTEQLIFEWLKTSKNPKFKEVQALIK